MASSKIRSKRGIQPARIHNKLKVFPFAINDFLIYTEYFIVASCCLVEDRIKNAMILQIFKSLLVFFCLLIYCVSAGGAQILLFWCKPAIRIKAVNRLTYWLMHIFKIIGQFKIKINGNKKILKQKGLFIISTHVGYIDGLILGTLLPGSYTTKSEIKDTPVLGAVVSIGQSIFIDRSKKSEIYNYIHVVSERLKSGINVFNFPEGHASNGTHILPFFKAFFDAPLKVKAPIVPIMIDYKALDGKTDYDRDLVYCADGKSSIIKHLWKLFKYHSLDIEVTLLHPIESNGHLPNAKGRKEISDLCMQRLAAHKNLPIAEFNPLSRREPSKTRAVDLSRT